MKVLTREEKETAYLKVIEQFKYDGWTVIYELEDLDYGILRDTLLVIKGKSSISLFLTHIRVKDYSNEIDTRTIYIDRAKFRDVMHFWSNADWNKKGE